MLALLFRLGTEHFALDLAGLTAILPNSRIRPIPHAPPEICGEFNWRGRMVPVIDLRQMFFGGATSLIIAKASIPVFMSA